MSSLGFLNIATTQATKTTRTQTSLAITHTPATRKKNFRETYLRPMLLGAIDGLITSFVIIAGGVAGNVQKSSVLIIAFSSLIADAMSMGVSETISSRSQNVISWQIALFKGLICFLSFVLFGIIPIVAYSLIRTETLSQIVSAVAFAFMLVVVGCIRAFITEESYPRTILEVTGVGVVTGMVAYSIAKLIPR